MALAFNDLPQAVQDLQTDVGSAMVGTVLGTTTPETPDVRMNQTAKAALVVVCEYAPGAPLELHREAATRLAGWLLGTRPHARSQSLSDPSGAGLQLEFLNGQATANGMRVSGASALLSRYVVRRAGAI